MGVVLKVSKYNHTLTIDERHYLFNALQAGLHRVDDSVVEALSRLAHGDADWGALTSQDNQHTLEACGYIVPDECDEDSTIYRQREAEQRQTKTLSLTIAPTLDCNFGCPYCFEGVNKPKLHMSPATMDALIKFVRRACKDDTTRIHVTWFGGEPLLAIPEIELITRKLEEAVLVERQITFGATVITNGYGLTRKVAERLLRLGIVRVQVTLDGTAAYHDKRRFLKVNSAPTFDRILENILDTCDLLNVSIRANLDRSNEVSFIPLVEKLRERGLAGKVMVYPAFTRDYGDSSWDASYCDNQEFEQTRADVYEATKDFGAKVYRYPRVVRNYCGAQSDMFWVVAPSGDLHKCWNTINSPDYAVGSVHGGVNEAALAFWQNWGKSESKCSSCSLRPLCMSGCAYDAMQHSGEPQCSISQSGLEHSLHAWVASQASSVKGPGQSPPA